MKSSEIRLGAFLLDTQTGQLVGDDGRVAELRHQSRQVLLKLASAPNEIVTKQTFFDEVWEGMHVSEDSLVQCIAEIRQAVRDTEKSIVETVPRKGYRLVPDQAKSAPVGWMKPSIIAACALLALLVVAGFMTLRPAPNQQVLAVLPFQDDSPDSSRGTLGDVVSEGILENLARYPELRVIARSSSFRFRTQDIDLREIGEKLGANFIVEGSQQFDGQSLRVTARLIDVSKNARVWSDQIETDIADLFKVTDEISQRVAHSVEGIIADVRAVESSQNEVDALLLSLKARKIMTSGLSPENLNAAIAIHREVIERYPEEPWGYVGLALGLRSQLRFGWSEEPMRVLEEAIGSAEKGVRLAPENYLAHFALGRVRMQEGNQLRAIEAFERSLQLNPSAADVLNALAQSYFYIGKNQEALEILAQSERIDPLPSFIHSWMSAWALWQGRQCDSALQSFARLAAPPPAAHKLLAAIHVCLGQEDAATKALDVFLEKEPAWTTSSERALHEKSWTADGDLDRWISNLVEAGLASN